MAGEEGGGRAVGREEVHLWDLEERQRQRRKSDRDPGVLGVWGGGAAAPSPRPAFSKYKLRVRPRARAWGQPTGPRHPPGAQQPAMACDEAQGSVESPDPV